jgi:hypothetical protein
MEEMIECKEEALRKLVDLSLQAGRKRQNPQTGFVHYCYHALEEDVHYTIPILENFLFALALFRTRTAENILEAKGLLNALLEFQSHEGNFPIYLHEYPQCKDRYVGVSILAPIYRLVTEFRLVLGAELKQRLEKAAERSLNQCIKHFQQKELPYAIGMKIAAAAKVFGAQWQNSALENEGEKLLESYLEQGEVSAWYQPNQIADILVALQMAYPHIASSPWNSFWDYLGKTWHLNTCTYLGPAIKVFQDEKEPQAGLYDLFLGYFSKKFSGRALVDHPFHLQAALIYPTDDVLKMPAELPAQFNFQDWTIYQTESYGYVVNHQKSLLSDKGYHFFRFIWGDAHRGHSFVIQGGNIQKIVTQANPNAIEFMFTLGEPVEFSDREKSREVQLFFDMYEGTKFLVNDIPANTFNLNENVKGQLHKLTFEMKTELSKGEGQLMGHIMRGNRPSQIANKGSQRFQAYDWQLFLRTLRRSQECEVKLMLKIGES